MNKGPKIKPAAERRTDSVIVFLTRGTRMQVEALARKDRASLSEVGRRAFESYLESKSATSTGSPGE